jgi:hypothetical protein
LLIRPQGGELAHVEEVAAGEAAAEVTKRAKVLREQTDDIVGAEHGVRETRTGACHFSENQAHAWGARFFTPAVKKAAARTEFLGVLGATPYSLRRGGISLRLRAEDPQTVASECGTSLRMLSDHYAYAIEDLRDNGPRPADLEWRAARAEQTAHDTPETPSPTGEAHDGARPHGKVRAWLAAHRRRAEVA